MAFINLTPHDVTILSAEGETLAVFPASGRLARCQVTTEALPSLGGYIPAARSIYGAVEGLPDPEFGVVYIVSGLVKARCPDRDDVCVPGDQVRDPGNPSRVIGCRRLDF